MTEEERIEICKSIAIACMWGQGGIGSVILEAFDKRLPSEPTWHDLHNSIAEDARRESVGTIDDEEDLRWRLSRGYWLTNYDDRGCALFNPQPMNGLSKYVSKRLAEKYPYKSWF